MLALSVRQPYAWLIVHGFKDIENRTWPTKFRGEFLVHASANYAKRDYQEDADYYGAQFNVPFPTYDAMVGGIVGQCRLIDCVRRSESRWFNGPHGFVLADARAFPLVPWKGMLGFFEVPDDFRTRKQTPGASSRIAKRTERPVNDRADFTSAQLALC